MMSSGQPGTDQHARIVWPIGAQLGEGPVWLPKEQMLWFVDIKAGMLHSFDAASTTGSSIAIGGQPSFVVPADDGSLIIGSDHTLQVFREGSLAGCLATLDMPARNRTNDGTVDCHGRLWFGTMDDGETLPTGGIYRLDGRSPRRVGGECIITNGPAISPDGRFLYHVDTVGGTIWRFDIASHDRLQDGDVFASIAPEDGNPDGVTIDSEGCLWVGIWGGWQARRYGPDGTLLDVVHVPCANVTKIALGGPDLRTAYVTTARVGLSDQALVEQPLAGGLFAFDAPAPGIPCPAVRLPS
jgi:xylono-1,5-lactonase